MKKTIFIIIILLNLAVSAQIIKHDLILTTISDTLFWKKINRERINEFNLTKIESINEDFVFRSWRPGSLLEITKTKSEIKGKLTYFVFEVWEENYKADKFVKQFNLPKDKAKSIYEFINSSGIIDLPSDKYIEKWQQGLDGITYIYETKSVLKYSFKHYWSPTAQNGIEQAEFIIAFNNEIEKVGELKQYGELFGKELPFLSYVYPGASYMMSRIVTKKEFRKYKKKRKKGNKKLINR